MGTAARSCGRQRDRARESKERREYERQKTPAVEAMVRVLVRPKETKLRSDTALIAR